MNLKIQCSQISDLPHYSFLQLNYYVYLFNALSVIASMHFLNYDQWIKDCALGAGQVYKR